MRFGLEAVLIGLYGDKALEAIMWLLDNEILLAVVMIVGGVAAWFAYDGGTTSDNNPL